MKYISLLLLAGVVSCNVLDQEPQVQISDQAAFNNAKSAEAALAGLYNQLQSGDYYGGSFIHQTECASDISQSVGTWDFYRELDTYSIDASNQEITDFYERAYKGINQANNLIAYVPQIADLTDEKKDNYLGQAYFIRGLVFFDLARTFGGIPGGVAGKLGIALPLTPATKIDESSYLSRASMAASYDQVKTDLEAALSLLPESQGSDAESRAMAVKGAARALLARYHLYMKEYDKAITYATSVIDDPRYILEPSFTNIYASKLTTESIFELAFDNIDQSDVRYWYFPGAQGGRGELAVHEDFVTEIQANPADIRGTLFGYDPIQGVYYPTKYQKPNDDDNVHILRVAEMYLIRAEARAIKGYPGAEDDLNAVRNRAGVADYNVGVDGDLLGAILKENKFEFAFEGHRWFDLVRTSNALTALASVNRKNSAAPVSLSDPDYLVFPIPRDETLSNPNMDQNDGYGK